MKRILIGMMLLAAVPLMVLAGKKAVVTVKGQPVEKAVKRITFSGDQVVLIFDDETQQTEPMGDVAVRFEEGTSGIAEVKASRTAGSGNIYDLQGRKMTGKAVKKGVYVVDGRKTVVR